MASVLGLSGICAWTSASCESSGAGDGVENSEVIASSSLILSTFLEVEGMDGLVTLFELGPKARVCWAWALCAAGLRRVGGMKAVVGEDWWVGTVQLWGLTLREWRVCWVGIDMTFASGDIMVAEVIYALSFRL